eukprot:397667-Rhodomonas_salina.4
MVLGFIALTIWVPPPASILMRSLVRGSLFDSKPTSTRPHAHIRVLTLFAIAHRSHPCATEVHTDLSSNAPTNERAQMWCAASVWSGDRGGPTTAHELVEVPRPLYVTSRSDVVYVTSRCEIAEGARWLQAAPESEIAHGAMFVKWNVPR